MAPERVIVCGGAAPAELPTRPAPVFLDIFGRRQNVNLDLEGLSRTLWADPPAPLRDLLDVAVYVYAADQAVERAGGGRVDGEEIGAGWRRNFRFRIPVRTPDLWNSDDVRTPLVSALSFLSEDEYAFEFYPLRKDTDLKGRINFNANPFHGEVGEVAMFSGGLDSLAGAVQRSLVDGKQVLLVHHRSNEKMTPHYSRLVRALRQVPGARVPLHFTFRANKAKRLGKEYTQRTRSFLFAAFGAVFARMIGLDRLTFFENGVTSLNLPPSAQVVGARASRTTHPRALAGFERFFTAVLGTRFKVESPFLWDTKTDVVKRIAGADCGNLIGLSTSCGHTWELSSTKHTHCGLCSQCIDRRFAVLAAGQAGNDPQDRYAVELLAGDRRDSRDRTMVAAYLDLAMRVEQMGEPEFFTQFGELARVLPHVGLPANVGATRVFDLYKRHARYVTGVVRGGVGTHAEAITRRELPRNCLLRIVYDDPEPGEATAEPPRPPGNSIRRRGRCWAIRFGENEEQYYTPDIGFEYLRLLLASPGSPFTASQLAAAIRRRSKCESSRESTHAPGDTLGLATPEGADEILDAKTRENYRVRLAEIEEEMQLVTASRTPEGVDRLDELEREKRFILSELAKARTVRGQARKLGDLRDRVRNRVCHAIRRALVQVGNYDPPLAGHLRRPVLNLGHSLSYVPPACVTWSLE